MNYQDLIKKMTLEEKASLLSGADFWQTKAIQRLDVPAMFLSDGPHGIRKQAGEADQLGLNASVPSTCFPTAATMANSWDSQLGEMLGEQLGEEAVAEKVNVLLGPGLNVKRSPLCGRNFEYFSEDPYLAGKMAAGYVKGIQSKGVAACPKHFAANNQELLRMANDSVVDERTFREIYMTAFEIVVREANPKAIMSAYNKINGTYANESKHLLTEILREEWGFQGIVVSDWGGSNDHVDGTRAGANLEMPTTGTDSDRELVAAVKAGTLDEAVLDQRVDELLTVVFDVTKATMEDSKFDVDAHHQFAQRASEESIVLLKNENQILPLKKDTKVAIIGNFAAEPRYQGAGSSVVNCTKLDSIMDNIATAPWEIAGFEQGYIRTGKEDSALVEKACQLAAQAEVVLLFIGLDEISESEGLDRSHMRLPKNQLVLLDALKETGKNIVVILSAGSAIEMPWAESCQAILHGYLTGQAGAKAILNVLSGEVNPSGKLSESYPFKYEDVSSAPYFPGTERTTEYRENLFVGYRYYETANVAVQYPFGFGMSYTTFTYSDLVVEKDKVRFTITNTGEVAGKEVAQLYVGLQDSAIFRPTKELKGFCKVLLQPKESKVVELPFDDKTFRYYNVKTNRFEVEEGTYQILIGASVADIRLSGELSVAGSQAPVPYESSFSRRFSTADIKQVSDEDFQELLGHPIPEKCWDRTKELTRNDAISQMFYAKSGIARLAYRIMTSIKNKSEAKGKPNLNILFIYNMPFRGIAKMTGGAMNMEMVDGLLVGVNGHFFKGIGQLLKARSRMIKANKETAQKLKEAGQEATK